MDSVSIRNVKFYEKFFQKVNLPKSVYVNQPYSFYSQHRFKYTIEDRDKYTSFYYVPYFPTP